MYLYLAFLIGNADASAQSNAQNGGQEKKMSIAAILMGVIMSFLYVKH